MELDEALGALESLAARLPASPGRVTWAVDGRVGTITLDHPAAWNAMSAAMMRDLAQVVRVALASDVEAVVLRGAGASGFCSGGYLDEVVSTLTEREAAAAMCGGMTAVLDALAAGPAVVIAALDGPAIGGGVELALAADLRVMRRGAWMELRQTRLGVVAGWGGAHRLVDRLGRGRALACMLAAERLPEERCLDLGLVDQLVEGSAGTEAVALARRVADGGVGRACKAQLAAAARGDAAAEAAAFLGTWGGPGHLDALAQARRR